MSRIDKLAILGLVIPLLMSYRASMPLTFQLQCAVIRQYAQRNYSIPHPAHFDCRLQWFRKDGTAQAFKLGIFWCVLILGT